MLVEDGTRSSNIRCTQPRRDHTRPCARYTHTRAFHTNDASQPYNLTSLTQEEEEEEEEEEMHEEEGEGEEQQQQQEEEEEGESEAGGWGSLSARRSRFPTSPRDRPWPPRAAANLT